MSRLNNLFDYIVQANRFNAFPLDWAEIFGNEHPITVEIGFGTGEYTIEMARRNPDVNYIGFETSQLAVSKTLKGMFKEKIENVRILMVDGRFGLRNLFKDESVECVILNFPTPWSKGKHFRRRVAVPDLFKTLGMILTKNGRLELVTDVVNYAVDVKSMAQEMGFETSEIEINPHRAITTHYEEKWRAYERNIHALSVYKNRFERAERLLKGGMNLDYSKLELKETFLEDLSEALKKSHKGNSGQQICIFKSFFHGDDGNSFLVKTIAVDLYDQAQGEFEQHFLIDVRKKAAHCSIRLDGIAFPFKTPAVKFSLKRLAEILTMN